MVAALPLFLALVGAGFVLGVWGTIGAIGLARRSGIIDLPAAHKIHTRPVGRIGGLGFVAGALPAWMVLFALDPALRTAPVLGVLLGCGVVAVTGLMDDRYNLPSLVKLAGIVVAALLPPLFGLVATVTASPAVNFALTVLFITAVPNAVNLLDGMDGLAAGVAVIACVGLVIFDSVHGGHASTVLLILPLLGGLLGFLRKNWHPAATFMGDVGSLSLGLMLSSLVLLSVSPVSALRVWAGALLIIGVPLADTGWVFVRRLVRDPRHLLDGDLSHTYNLLARQGLSQIATVLVMYAAAAAGVALGLLIAGGAGFPFAVAMLSTVGVALVAWRAVRLSRPSERTLWIRPRLE